MDFNSSDVFPQILIAVIIALVVFFAYMIAEQIYKAWNSGVVVSMPVFNCTVASGTPQIFRQDPSNPSNSVILQLSENQLTGIEFSYTTFVYVSAATDDSTDGWKTIFYKGYESGPMPLLAPGVFVSASNGGNHSPTLRVVMNTYSEWFNVLDVEQIPFNKWFHMALVLRKNSMEVYINGNLANRASFNGTLPYQNYEPLNVFPNVKTPFTLFDNTQNNPKESSMGVPPGENMTVSGSFSGYVSNFKYYSYAITYSEIQAVLNQGPSSATCQTGNGLDQPPYLIDSWWTQKK